MEIISILKSLSFLPKLVVSLASPQIERSQLVIGVLKEIGVNILKPDFESIYAHALVEYAIDKPKNDIWITFFSLKETAEYIKTHLYKKTEEELVYQLDGLLHTGRGEVFLQLKKASIQTEDVKTEYLKLQKYIETYIQKSTDKNLPQAQNIELSKEILAKITELKEEVAKEENQSVEILQKLDLHSQSLGVEIADLTKDVKQSHLFLAALTQKISEAKLSKEQISQIADKIYNIGSADNPTFNQKGNIINNINQTIVYGQHHIRRLLTSPPFIPPVFLGRESDLATVHQRLFAGENFLMLVNGQGGIGKTSFAAKYWEKYQNDYAHLAFLFVENGIANALLSLSRNLGLRFTTESQEEQIRLLIETVNNLKKPCLLILDNANNEKDLKENYMVLNQCRNFHILLTSRLDSFAEAQKHSIGVLDKADALAVFKEHYKLLQEAEIPLFEEIYKAVGGNTLVLELMAKNLSNFNNKLRKKYSLQNLLDDLQKGLTKLSQSKAIDTAYQAKGTGLRNESPEVIILSMYDLTELTDAEQALLSVFAVLPAENIEFDTLTKLLQNENIDDTLLDLTQKGWIEENETTFKTSPVVQEIVRHKNQERLFEDCEKIITGLNEGLNYSENTERFHQENYKYSTLYSHYAESVVNNFQLHYNIALLLERTGVFYVTTGNLQKAINLFEKYKLMAEKLCILEPTDENYKNALAISYSKLGETQSSFGNLEKALEYFEKYNNLEKELYVAYPTNVSFKNGLAISYSKLGETQSSFGNLEKALEYFEKYNNLEKQLYAAYPTNVSFKDSLAISYSKLGDTQSSLGDLEKALEYFEKDIELSKELYEAYPTNVSFKNGLQISYEKLGDTYTTLGKLEKALEFYQQENIIVKELYEAYPTNVSFKNGLAISYIKLGYHAEQTNDKQKAKMYYLESQKYYLELTKSFPAYVQFQKNLQWVESRLAGL